MAEIRKPLIARRATGWLIALVLVAGSATSARADTFDSLLRRGEGYLIQAQKAYTSGQHKLREQFAAKAEDAFKAAKRLNNRDLRVWFLGCQAAAFKGDSGSASVWYQGYRARTVHVVNDPDLQYLQAFIYIFAADLPDRAILALTRMQSLDARRRPIERDTLMYIARLMRGNALMQSDTNLQAVKQFSEAARVARRRGWLRKEHAALGNMGIALKFATEWKRAIIVFDDLIRRDPNNVLWHWHKGLALGSEHRFADAIPVYRKVIELLGKTGVHATHRSDVEQVYMRYGNCMRQVAGQITQDTKRRTALLKDAEVQLKKYVELHPKVAPGYRWLGELYFRDLEQPYKAIPMYEKALELDWVCGDVPLRSLVQIHAQNPPPDGPEPEEARRDAWVKRRIELQKLRDDGVEKRDKAKKERERNSAEQSDGCG